VYDSNFAYYRHLHRGEADWEKSVRGLYAARSSGAVPRPPRTLVQQVQVINKITTNQTANVTVNNTLNLTHVQNVTVLAPVKQVNNLKVTQLGGLTPQVQTKVPAKTLKVQPVPKEELIRAQKAAVQVQDFGAKRQGTEAKLLQEGKIPIKHTDAPNPVKMPIPKPPPHVGNPPPPVRVAPALPMIPKHVEQPIPKYEPHKPPAPPKKDKKG
jgi:hypothetical protein